MNEKYPKNAGENIIIAADHAGFALKQKFLATRLVGALDMGTYSTESVDYPDVVNDFAKTLDIELAKFADSLGILICGSGIGVSIAANRYRHIRAALCTSVEMAKLAREHNHANVLCLGSRLSGFRDMPEAILEAFLTTPPSFETRHQRRMQKLGF